MSFFIFLKNLDNVEGSLNKIAENENDLNNLNIIQSDYKIIEDSQENFNAVKYKTKSIDKYNSNQIFYEDSSIKFLNKEELSNYIVLTKYAIQMFLDSNQNHSLFNQWNNYKNQLVSTYKKLKIMKAYK